MSNVKNINIFGTMPFNADQNEHLLKMLVQFNLPSMGCKITYDNTYQYVENKLGGKTAMYPFTLQGHEALPFAFINKFCNLVRDVGGCISVQIVQDLEG